MCTHDLRTNTISNTPSSKSFNNVEQKTSWSAKHIEVCPTQSAFCSQNFEKFGTEAFIEDDKFALIHHRTATVNFSDITSLLTQIY